MLLTDTYKNAKTLTLGQRILLLFDSADYEDYPAFADKRFCAISEIRYDENGEAFPLFKGNYEDIVKLVEELEDFMRNYNNGNKAVRYFVCVKDKWSTNNEMYKGYRSLEKAKSLLGYNEEVIKKEYERDTDGKWFFVREETI